MPSTESESSDIDAPSLWKEDQAIIAEGWWHGEESWTDRACTHSEPGVDHVLACCGRPEVRDAHVKPESTEQRILDP